MWHLPLDKVLIPGDATESDERVIDSASFPMRLITSVFEHVTPFDPHNTFCIDTEYPLPSSNLPFDNI
jgi:hypothetical protein